VTSYKQPVSTVLRNGEVMSGLRVLLAMVGMVAITTLLLFAQLA
jgi:hypothetical protein